MCTNQVHKLSSCCHVPVVDVSIDSVCQCQNWSSGVRRVHPHASFDPVFSSSIFCFAPCLLFLSGVSLLLFLLFVHELFFFGFLQFKTECIGIKRSKIGVEFRVFEIWFSGVDQFNIFAIDIVWHPTGFVPAVHQRTVPRVGQRF